MGKHQIPPGFVSDSQRKIARQIIRDFDICINPERKRFNQFLVDEVVPISRNSVVDGVIVVMRERLEPNIDQALVEEITYLVQMLAPVWDGAELIEMSRLKKPGFLARWAIRHMKIRVSLDKKRFYRADKGKLVNFYKAHIEQIITLLMGLEAKTSIISDAVNQIKFLAPVYKEKNDDRDI